MRIAAISLLSMVTLTGCFALHANIPEDVVRRHAAREEGVDLGAICSHEGNNYSEGALVCMGGQRMSCDATGRWIASGECR